MDRPIFYMDGEDVQDIQIAYILSVRNIIVEFSPSPSCQSSPSM